MNFLLSRFAAFSLLLALVFSQAAAQTDAPALRIVTTTTQVTDLAHILAGDLVGDHVEITALMGAGVDPHLYTPTEADIAAMNKAHLVLYSGLHLEGQFDTIFEALGQSNVRTYAVAKPVKDAGFIIGGFDLSDELQDVDDPHFWFDPRNWQLASDGLAEVLAQTDPDNADLYAANAEAYSEQLELLYDWGVEAMSSLPESQRILVTSHDAFQYFGEAFGWQVRGLQGISTESEAGVADVQAVADYVIEQAIPVIFVESSVPPNTLKAVQAAVQAEGKEVQIGVRELFSDAMGDPDSFGGTYAGMIAQNIITILQSYGYDIPEFPEALTLEIPEALLTLAAAATDAE